MLNCNHTPTTSGIEVPVSRESLWWYEARPFERIEDHNQMPTLEWIGKKAVLNHHREVPYRLLSADPSLSKGESGSGNLIVQGDNLVALKALLPYYAGKVKCIYIDPPY